MAFYFYWCTHDLCRNFCYFKCLFWPDSKKFSWHLLAHPSSGKTFDILIPRFTRSLPPLTVYNSAHSFPLRCVFFLFKYTIDRNNYIDSLDIFKEWNHIKLYRARAECSLQGQHTMESDIKHEKPFMESISARSSILFHLPVGYIKTAEPHNLITMKLLVFAVFLAVFSPIRVSTNTHQANLICLFLL